MTRKEPVAMEIVDDKAVPVEPVSDAVQAAADAPQGPDAEELASATQAQEPLPAVHRLEHARALPEVAKDAPGAPVEIVSDGIQSFKDVDGRTMFVVARDRTLYKQEV